MRQKKIAKFLGVTKQYVSKVIKEYINEGHLIFDNKKDKCKFYSPTRKKPKFLVNQKIQKSVNHFSPVQPVDFTGSSQDGVYSTSKSQWSCPIQNLTKKRDFQQWESYPMKHGTVKYYMDYFFSDPVNTILRFQITAGKNNATMTLVFPPVRFDNEEDFRNFERDVGDYVKRAMRYIAKKYNIGMVVADAHIAPKKNGGKCVDYETQVREVDKKIIQPFVPMESKYMEKGVQKKIMYDGSGGIIKCEGNTPETAIQYLSLPKIYQEFIEYKKQIENEIKEMVSFAKEITDVTKQFNELKNLISVRKKTDEETERENLECGMI